jgi:small subunit ribosomal protein S18
MSMIQDTQMQNNNSAQQERFVPNLIPNAVLFNRKSNHHSSPQCPLEGENIDYKNIALLTQYVTPAGRIIPSRISGVSQPNQRKLRHAIKRARMLALLPFSSR